MPKSDCSEIGGFAIMIGMGIWGLYDPHAFGGLTQQESAAYTARLYNSTPTSDFSEISRCVTDVNKFVAAKRQPTNGTIETSVPMTEWKKETWTQDQIHDACKESIREYYANRGTGRATRLTVVLPAPALSAG